MKALEEGPYGRCVYRCDNNVCDHQVTNIEFENGVTATFHLTAFSNQVHRTIKVMCENGNIYGDSASNTLMVTRFASNGVEEYSTEILHLQKPGSGHGGGDSNLMEDFMSLLEGGAAAEESRSSIARSVESHLMAYAAERSRLTASVVEMAELRQKLAGEN